MNRPAAACLIAFACTATLSVGGDDLLPLVHPKGSETRAASMTSGTSEPSYLLIDTPIEPERSFAGDTIEAAARRNDYQAFEELYAKAHDRARWRTLHEVWTYAETDRVGAFFDDAMRGRIAAAYPGFAAYIDDYRVIDSHGHSYFPSTETRHFLLERAVKDVRPEQSVRIATSTPTPHRARKHAHGPRASASHVKAVAATPAPVVVQATAPVVQAPVVQAPVAVQAAAPITKPAAPTAPAEDTTAPGILLIVMGLAGIGVMMLILRAPKSAPPSLELGGPPSADTQPGVKIDAKSSETAGHRATGSHG